MKYKTEREFHKDFLLKEGDYRSIREMLGRINRMIPHKVLLAELDAGNNMVEYTAQNIYNEVMALGEGLVAEGLKGAHTAIVSENCCRYVIADISISSGVGVVVPVDVNSPDNLMATLLQKSDADAVLCGADLVELMVQMQQCCPRLKKIITLDRKVEGYTYYEEIVGKGKTLDGEYRNVELDLDAPAKILFTSGTTGANKGVVLTNANLAANMVNCMDSIMTAGDTTSMSVLPMHHATEINTHIMTRIGSGRLTYVNGNMRNLMKNMKVFKPHLITVVPMIANAFYRNIQAGDKKAGKEEKLQKGLELSNMLRKIGIDRTHKMFADLFVPFGGNLNMIVCGGSMLNPVVIKGMNDLGVRMENGYGITECGPLISINGDTLSEHLSVGKPCPGLQAKIASPVADGIGDLCVKGKSVFKEYYKDPEATAAVFDEEGFFNTGDSARIESKGRIFLVGRKKNTIVLENGKNVCPEEIENVIETNMGYADEIAVYQAELKVGNVSRSVICAGIFIKDEQERGNRRAIEADMERINALLPDYKRIEYVELPSSEYQKTSSRKIIRKNLPQNCSGEGILLM